MWGEGRARSPGPARPHREFGLDVLRGIAILLVLDFHYGNMLARGLRAVGFPEFEGSAGVTIFFVLSGFLVGGLLIHEWRKTSAIRGGRFLVRRAMKLWPQYYLYLFLILLSGHRTLRESVGNLLNVQNYAGGIPHTWTLAVEEHTYLLLTAVLVLAASLNVSMRRLFWGVAGFALLVGGYRTVEVLRGAPVAWQTHYRLDGILFGVMLAMVHELAPARFAWWQKKTEIWVGVLVGVLVLERALVGTRALEWCEFHIMNLMGIALLMLFVRYRSEGVLARAVAWTGLYSYGIYLWHVSVVIPLAAVEVRLHVHLPASVAGLAAVAAGIAMGYVTTRVVEIPMLRLRDRLFPKHVPASPLEVGAEDVVRSGEVPTEPLVVQPGALSLEP